MTIIDTSVVTKWFFPEEEFQKALFIRNQHQREEISLYAPTLLLFELGNVFVSKGLKNRTAFNENVRTLYNLNLNFIHPEEQTLELAFGHSQKYNLSFYDALYVATAQNLKCDFITADKKLYQKTKKLKFVKLLSNFPII